MSMSALGAAPAAGWLSVGREAASACELVSGGAVCGVTVEPSSSADFSRQTHTSRLSSIPQDAGLEYVLKSRRVAGVEEAIKMEQPSATTCSNSVPPTSCTWMPLLGGAAPVLATSLGMVAAAHSSADSMAFIPDSSQLPEETVAYTFDAIFTDGRDGDSPAASATVSATSRCPSSVRSGASEAPGRGNEAGVVGTEGLVGGSLQRQ
mmetsp:Transcript_46303/g.118209  ORF Transcript_46303/g.118209 Transcript_46303/m.118209 type:complete len:207 (-) Transcript_46303:123-743(-)